MVRDAQIHVVTSSRSAFVRCSSAEFVIWQRFLRYLSKDKLSSATSVYEFYFPLEPDMRHISRTGYHNFSIFSALVPESTELLSERP